jgi:hypothetical protein
MGDDRLLTVTASDTVNPLRQRSGRPSSPARLHSSPSRKHLTRLKVERCCASDPRRDLLLPKPDRPLLSRARMGNGAGRCCFGVVRGCPLETGQDRCEWHGSGTAGEDDDRSHVPRPLRSWTGRPGTGGRPLSAGHGRCGNDIRGRTGYCKLSTLDSVADKNSKRVGDELLKPY